LFSLNFNPPQNFAAYRQSELDTARMSSFTAIEQYPYISKRFALERFLGLSEEEINKNEKMWREEQNKDTDIDPKGNDLRSVGVSVGDIETDQNTADEMEDMEDMGDETMMGPEVAGAVGDAGPMPGNPAPGGTGM
jgi:hypothetical protein